MPAPAPALPSRARAGLPGTRLEPSTILHEVARAPSSAEMERGSREGICDVLIQKETELNALDAKVGDGDTGTTFRRRGQEA